MKKLRRRRINVRKMQLQANEMKCQEQIEKNDKRAKDIQTFFAESLKENLAKKMENDLRKMKYEEVVDF